jgi:hypothetical protein
VIIHDLDIVCVPIPPLETDPELIVDPNAVMSFAISLEGLQVETKADSDPEARLQHPREPAGHGRLFRWLETSC